MKNFKDMLKNTIHVPVLKAMAVGDGNGNGNGNGYETQRQSMQLYVPIPSSAVMFKNCKVFQQNFQKSVYI